jgi:hypothetical protein
MFGPLIKLTAIPVVTYAIMRMWTQRGAPKGIACAIASLLFIPLQFLRGWGWGGTVELNAPVAVLEESLFTSVIGFGRTVYAFTKTFFWLGEWSFFRPPLWLVVGAVLVAAAFLAQVRFRIIPGVVLPHLLAAVVAVLGFTLYAVKNRLYFAMWGGVGGWYAWGWYPWLWVLADDLFVLRRSDRWWSGLRLAGVALLVTTNLVWFMAAIRLYGW